MIIHGVDLIDKNDKVIDEFNRQGFWEPDSMKAWKGACHGTVIDVGAYTGIYSIVAAKAGANVVALEPNSEVYKRLVENCIRNSVAIEALEVAAGSTIGAGRLNTESRPPLTTAGTLVGDKGKLVDIVPLDSMALDNVTAIKIDVERYEIEVLTGAQLTIEKHRPLLICEALGRDESSRLIEWMSPYPYRPDFVDIRNVVFWPKGE